MDQPRGRGRARGRARGTDARSQQQGAQQRPGSAAPSQQQQRGPPQQPQQPPAWGPRSQVQHQQQIRAPAPQPQFMQVGRATYRVESGGTTPGETQHSGTVFGGGDTLATHGRGGAMRGRRQPAEILITKPPHVDCKQGSFGKRVALSANYFEVLSAAGWTLFQYRVDFAPDEDRTFVKKKLMRRATASILTGYLFDGTVLYTPNRLVPDPMELFVDDDETANRFRITVRLVGEVDKSDYQRLQVFNIILRKCLSCLKLQLVGRDYYDAAAKISIPEHKMELWPGYITSIRQHESQILLCAEVSSKVMRMDTVYHFLLECSRQDSAKYKQLFQAGIIGSVVLTDYNNRTYNIDDVDWEQTPRSTFHAKGADISYVDYYRSRYNIQIRDLQQPLLISRAKNREIRAGMPDHLCLIPELCRMTGLTEAQRSNFQLMRALAEHTRVAPRARIDKLVKFCQRLRNEQMVMEELRRWDLKLAENIIEISGRVIPPETICVGRNVKFLAGQEADWTRDLRSNPMLTMARIDSWVIVTPSRSRRAAENFTGLLNKASSGMSWSIPSPRIYEIREDRPGMYLEALEHVINTMRPSMIMCVVSNNKADRYSAIKKKCSVERAVPTQVVVARNLESKGAMTIATKIAIQMNCKLGGAPWSVPIPLQDLMVIGFDVCHDTSDKRKSFGATVASLDKALSRYYNVCSAHPSGEEMSNDFAFNVIKAIKMWQELRGKVPTHILIYRDGVGEGQFNHVLNHEVKRIEEQLKANYYPNGTLKMAFIIVSKRINTRIFTNHGDNPLPGTVVDDVITLPERYDFFIVSQCVRQGTVAPTSYNIVYDTTNLSVDHLQRLTYKLTHLYYNWSGTVRVPAPCQYAHKLAFLAGQSLHREPHKDLDTLLHYL